MTPKKSVPDKDIYNKVDHHQEIITLNFLKNNVFKRKF